MLIPLNFRFIQLYKKETVLKSVRRSAVDHIVGHISLLFELVYMSCRCVIYTDIYFESNRRKYKTIKAVNYYT
jgi:uncharacterized membrane protein